MTKYWLVLLLAVSLLAGCTVSKVTGKKQLILVSEAQELIIGKQQYAPMRQAQGGDYLLDPQLNAYVNKVGRRLAAGSGQNLPYEFRVLNNSSPNAWALPGGKIVLNRGLLTELDSEAEMAAVLSHEITHAAARHTAQNLSRGMLLQGAVMATVLATRDSDYGQLAELGAGIGAQLVTQKYGRDAEREADYYGMKFMSRAGYDTQGAVDLQKTFVKLSQGRQQNWLTGLFASHPPSQERVVANVESLAEFPPGGEAGRQRFHTRLAHLKKTKPAYEAYEKGRKALADGNVSLARQLAMQARQMEPREAHFVALLGDIEEKRGNNQTALVHYSEAMQMNENFFYYHLKQGIVNEKLGNLQQAKLDLDKSIRLLPTANAYNSLGNIARSEQRYADAKNYFEKAAQDKTDTGKLAYASLVELDLADNPGEYLKVELAVYATKRVVAKVSNSTPINISGIVLGVYYLDAAGRKQGGEVPVRGTLQSGRTANITLGLQNLDKNKLQSLRVTVLKAGVDR